MDCGFEGNPELLVFNGPTISINIGFDAEWDPSSPKIPKSDIDEVHALIDTGATVSCIDAQLATALNLPIVNREQMAGISGPYTANVYLAQVYVPSLDFTIHGAFAGVGLHLGGQPHSALLGRTFLRRFELMYYGATGAVYIVN